MTRNNDEQAAEGLREIIEQALLYGGLVEPMFNQARSIGWGNTCIIDDPVTKRSYQIIVEVVNTPEEIINKQT
jgi:hypothetical protein